MALIELSGEMKLINDLIVAQKYLKESIIKGFDHILTPAEIAEFVYNQVDKRVFLKTWLITGFRPKGDGYITCYYCGRPLTNTDSRILGCGPICHERYGDVPGRSKDTEIIYQEYLKRAIGKVMSLKQYFSVRGGN